MLSLVMKYQVQNSSCKNIRSLCQTLSIGNNQVQSNIFQNNFTNTPKIDNQLPEATQKSNQIITSDSQKLFQPIGVIQSTWFEDNGKLSSIKFGTAFAVAPRVIMTCTHNIFCQDKSAFCSEITFYPNINMGSLQTQVGYKSQKNKFYHCFKPKCSLSYVPQKQEICLIVLKETLKIQNFIQIGQGSQKISKLNIISYPSPKYKPDSVEVTRKQSCGQIYSIENNIIKHTIKTVCGESGSPILQKDEQGRWKAIGIHTHLGLSFQYNSGVYFNADTIRIVKTLLKEIKSMHKQEMQFVNSIQLNDDDELKNDIQNVEIQSQPGSLNQQASIYLSEYQDSQSSYIHIQDQCKQNQLDQGFQKIDSEVVSFLSNQELDEEQAQQCGIQTENIQQQLEKVSNQIIDTSQGQYIISKKVQVQTSSNPFGLAAQLLETTKEVQEIDQNQESFIKTFQQIQLMHNSLIPKNELTNQKHPHDSAYQNHQDYDKNSEDLSNTNIYLTN